MISHRLPWHAPWPASSRLENATAVLASESKFDLERRRQAQGPFLPVSPPLRSGSTLWLTGLQELIQLDADSLNVTGRDEQPRLSNEGAAILPDGRLIYVEVHATTLRTADGQVFHDAGGRISSRIAFTPDGKPVVGVAPNQIQVVGGPTCLIPPAAEQTPECDRVLALAAGEQALVGLTRDGRAVGFGHDGRLLWSVSEKMTWPRVPPVFSPDQKTVYLASVEGAVVALNAENGSERWRCKIEGHALTPPALDKMGNLHLYTSPSLVVKISSEGKLERSTPSGTTYYVSMGYSPQLELDRMGNALVLANPDETLVFSPEGYRLMRLTTAELFDGMGEFVDSFALSPERDRAILLSGSRGVTEVELPRTPQEQKARLRAAIARRESQREGPQVAVQEDWVTVRGARLRRRKLEG